MAVQGAGRQKKVAVPTAKDSNIRGWLRNSVFKSQPQEVRNGDDHDEMCIRDRA